MNSAVVSSFVCLRLIDRPLILSTIFSAKRFQSFETKCLSKLLRISCLEQHKTNDWVWSKITRPTTGCGARSTPLWVRRNLFWQPSRDGNSHASGMSRASTAKSIPNAGWTTSKSGYHCSRQKYSQWPPTEKSGRGSLLNRPPRPTDNPVGQETELN